MATVMKLNPPFPAKILKPASLGRELLLGLGAGISAGLAAALFLWLLDAATRARENNFYLVFGLPFFGWLGAWAYHRHGRGTGRGSSLLLEEIHEPRAGIPARMAPLVLFSTLLTHLGGGSAGREGTAVQMGGSLSDQWSRFLKASAAERKLALTAGLGAGFGAAIGAPLAGIIFGLEVASGGRLHFRAFFICAIASPLAFALTRLCRAPHAEYPLWQPSFLGLREWLFLLAVGLAFGVSARLFIWLTHAVEKGFAKIANPTLRPLIGGILLLAAYYALGTLRYAGLGIPVIQAALTNPSSYLDAPVKGLLTALTLGAGFKGGEFIPLVFVGTTLGGALAAALNMPVALLASVGFSSVFGAAAKTPLACAVMAAELFGPAIFPYALAAGYVAYFSSGPNTVYPGQRR
ncbi:MAG: voltage-gated chloride channel family protein [Proteobacteria bacterium]|nr:MAG: voltage-gated chloride channel family protein [Pseudomonadota bacterium]